MTHGSRKSTRDKRVMKISDWVKENIQCGELFMVSDIANDLNMTSQETVRLFPQLVDVIEKSPTRNMWVRKPLIG